MRILAIETSCDETAASVVEFLNNKVAVLSNIISSQIEIHKKYGGVVPEVAAREHVVNILPVINEALEKSKSDKKNIDAIAVTVGPGLITSLLVGIETARSLAFAWDLPLIPVNHIGGHIYANFIGANFDKNKKTVFPAIVLTVSGGHNLLVLMSGHNKFKVIGETLDDAAGEAFDKAAAMLNIGYPGGPIISAEAAKFKIQNLSASRQGSKLKIALPRPMLHKKNFDFSFSGLKTALLYQIQKDKTWKERISEYAYEFQQAVIDVLVGKTLKAAKEYKAKTIMLAGGVSANKELRKQLEEAAGSHIPDFEFKNPDLQYTTDNAAMIGAAACFLAKQKKFVKYDRIKVSPNLELV